ncbi:MAG: glycosyl hydrolase, partial [Gemmatimonas sp.]
NGTHSDFHDLWIDPDDATHLVVGNDGGGAVSTNTGGAWTAQDYPTEQFYHIAKTASMPYAVCGAQQDASTLCVPFNWNLAGAGGGRGGFGGGGGGGRGGGGGGGGAPNPYADVANGGMAVSYTAAGGEPGYIAPDPLDPDIFYSGTNNGGYLDKYNRRTGITREVNPYPWFYSGEPSKEIKERWQWTFPIIFSEVNPKMLFTSSQRLWRTLDGGRTWKALSGDLTRHAPETMEKSGGPITGDMNGPEVYGVIFSIGPSKVNANVIWTGSDDGLVHVTQDGGLTWKNVTPKDMPDFGRVSQIDASKFSAGTAYISVRKPLLGDRSPYIFKTNDFGRTWTKIVNGIRSDAYVHAVREDPYRKGLLYAATQSGVYMSYDDGATWENLRLNMPDVPVSDLIVTDNELAISTHGRGFWILDNITPLRQATPAILAADAHLYAPPPAIRSGPAAAFTYKLSTVPKRIELAILDSAGGVMRSFIPDTTPPGAAPAGGGGRRGGAAASLPKNIGFNRYTWDLRTPSIESFPGMILWGAGTNGPVVPPGKYKVRLVVDGKTLEAPLEVKRNPLITDVTDADLRAQYAFGKKVRDKATEANMAVIQIRRVKAQLEDRLKKAADDAALKSAGATLTTNATGVETSVYQTKNQSGQDPLNFPIKVNNRIANLLSMSERGDGPPNQSMPEIFGILTTELKGYTDRLAVVWKTDLAAVNKELARLKLPAIDPTCAKAEGCTAVP